MLTADAVLSRDHVLPVASEADGRRLDLLVRNGRVWYRSTAADGKVLTAESIHVALVHYHLTLPTAPTPAPTATQEEEPTTMPAR